MSTKTDLLDLLKKNIGTPISGQQAAERLGVSRNAVWKAISHLKEEGYPIESRTRAGYCLTGIPDLLTLEHVRPHVLPDLDVDLHVEDTVTSTNDVVKQAAWNDRPIVVIANRQTGGRGRLGRKFESPGGTGIYISIGIKPDFSIAHSPFVTMAAAVAVCRAVKKVCGLETDIKWVNDVYYNRKKVCGILTEAQTNMENGEILAKSSAGNGQIRFGADVINRIIESQKPGGHERLQNAIIKETLNPMISNMCRAAKISSQQIYRAAIAGNTTMEHLMMGINADPLRMEPYIPAFFKTNSLFASDVNLAIHPDAHIILAPNIGSYVGGDITAGALVSMIWNRPEMSLFIDLGTNGELAFGNSDFMVSCACSAGPAFEGGDISCGMRATDGAIEKCTIDPETMEPSYHVIGDEGTKPIGLCGSGIIDVIAALFRAKMVNPKGKFIREGRRIRHDKYGMGSYVIAFEEEAGSVRDVEITEVDIDNFIRAKGAIFSAIRTMLNYLDMDVSMIEEVYVAGGIGSGINMKNAVTIGMFPDIPLEKFHYIGNSSLTGAYSMLLSTAAEKKTYEVARNMTYLELSTVPTYMDEFVAACFLPHTDTTMFPSVEA